MINPDGWRDSEVESQQISGLNAQLLMENLIVQISAMESNGVSQRLCSALVPTSTVIVYRLI
jgi:hypothetical protein